MYVCHWNYFYCLFLFTEYFGSFVQGSAVSCNISTGCIAMNESKVKYYSLLSHLKNVLLFVKDLNF